MKLIITMVILMFVSLAITIALFKGGGDEYATGFSARDMDRLSHLCMVNY